MELSRVLQRRRSLREFAAKPVEAAKIERLLEAARGAPSAGNTQPWRFIVVDQEAETRRAVEAALNRGNAWAHQAPVLIVAATVPAESPQVESRAYPAHDTALALMALILRAVDLSLVAHPMAGWAEEALREAVNLPPEIQPITVTAVGYGTSPTTVDPQRQAKDARSRARKPLGEVAFQARFGVPFEPTLPEQPARVFEADVPLRFADLDTMGHVNNAVTFTLLEQGRLEFFTRVCGAASPGDFPFVVAEARCDYRRPIRLADRIRVRMHVTDVARSSFRFVYELVDPRHGTVFAEAETVQVIYDYEARRPTRIPAALLEQLRDYASASSNRSPTRGGEAL